MINWGLAKRFLFLGFTNIWRHKLRSSLTILGIVFGVGSVIAMLAVGEGASYEAQEQIKRLGSQNIIVKSVKPPESDKVSTERTFLNEYGLTYKDAECIRSTIPGVEVLVPSRSFREDMTYRRKRLDGNVIGTVPWYPVIANRKVTKGRFINSVEMHESKNVCVLTRRLEERLFTFEDSIGKIIAVGGDCYTVVGILEDPLTEAGSASENGGAMNIYIPITAAKARFGEIIMTERTGSFSMERIELSEIIVKVDDIAQVVPASQIVSGILKRFHKNVDYEIVVPLELLRQAEHTKRIFNIVLGSIAAISLLVGGIGIMNIMLASVTERTREIGIRRALGAKRRDIITQFLTETIILSSSGGIIGLFFGMAIPFFITSFADMKTIIRLWALLGAFSISILIGIVFGLYPAYRAAMMNPITALRHE